METTSEKRLKTLFSSHSIPSLEVIIPIIEKSGLGEKELTTQIYDAYTSLANGIKEILSLRGNDMRTLAKVWETVAGVEGVKIQPLELSESRFSLSITDCPMIHVGKRLSLHAKSKFCDSVCTGGSKALMDSVLGLNKGTCSWNKALIRGERKCTLVFELVSAE